MVFSLWLIGIVNLKLSIHALRRSDVNFLHNEHYMASMAHSGNAATHSNNNPVTQNQNQNCYPASMAHSGNAATGHNNYMTQNQNNNPAGVQMHSHSYKDVGSATHNCASMHMHSAHSHSYKDVMSTTQNSPMGASEFRRRGSVPTTRGSHRYVHVCMYVCCAKTDSACVYYICMYVRMCKHRYNAYDKGVP
jgi:hypothetical protein